MKLTIYDIAEALELAPSTISKVINNKGKVSKETRARVLEYIKEVGYVPASSARMLKSERTYQIGIVFSEDLQIGLEHSFFSSILQHFKNYVEARGYELSFIVQRLGDHHLSYYEWCINKRVDGVYIVVGDYNDKGILELADKDIPVVSTDILIDGVKTVISNNKQGIYLSLDYFFEKAKIKKVGMIYGPLRSKAFKERYDAFYEYFKEHNLTPYEPSIIESKSFGFTSGYNACLELIKRNALAEGIIVGSDEIATGVIKCLHDHNIKIPDEVQIIGFDDVVFARYITPSLTTIRQDRVKMGELAAKNLLYMIENKTTNIKDREVVNVTLVERETTKVY